MSANLNDDSEALHVVYDRPGLHKILGANFQSFPTGRTGVFHYRHDATINGKVQFAQTECFNLGHIEVDYKACVLQMRLGPSANVNSRPAIVCETRAIEE